MTTVTTRTAASLIGQDEEASACWDLANDLERSPDTLELDAPRMIRRLETASPSQLRFSAVRLVQLLDDPAFGCTVAHGVTLRPTVVAAVQRAGYPWALQLQPEDLQPVAPAREPKPGWGTRFRQALLVSTILGVVAVALGESLGGFAREVPPASSSSRRLVPAQALVPPTEREDLLVSMMREQASTDRLTSFAIAFDCLGDPELRREKCAVELAAMLRAHAREARDDRYAATATKLEARLLAWNMRGTSEHLRVGDLIFSAVPSRTRFFRRPDQQAELTALRLFEQGDLPGAMNAADRCLHADAYSLQCAAIMLNALDVIDFPGRSARETKLKRNIAWRLARESRDTCYLMPRGCW